MSVRPLKRASSTIPAQSQFKYILGMAAGVSVGYRNTHMFENASKVDTSKIAGLNRHQASQ